MSDIRYDRIHDTHVIIAPERLHRPDFHTLERKDETAIEACPFCEGNEALTPPEIFALRKEGTLPDEKGWLTRVVPNLYKAVQIEAAHAHHYGLFEHWEGFGAHEVIIDTPAHHTSMTQWSKAEVVQWLQTLRARVTDLKQDGRIAYISLFKNEGSDAGATQQHSHTQLIALPMMPKNFRESYQRNYEYYRAHSRALPEIELAHEEEAGERIIATQGDFTAYAPYASAYPFEVIISSKKVLGQIDTLHDDAIEQIAPLLKIILKNMKKKLGAFSFNLAVSTPPLQWNDFEYDILSVRDEVCRFSIRIMPRLYKLGGFEVSTGVMINPVSPEHAAKILRESIDG